MPLRPGRSFEPMGETPWHRTWTPSWTTWNYARTWEFTPAGATPPPWTRRPMPRRCAAAVPRLPARPPRAPIPGAAAARAAKLASDAMALDLAQAAGDPVASRETVRLLLAHQVAAGHSLMMRLTAIADAYVNYVQPAAMRDPYLSRCPQEAVRLAHGAARLMERVRAAALALQRLGYPGTADPLPPAPPPRTSHPPENNPDPSSPGDKPPPGTGADAPSGRTAVAHIRRGRLNNDNPPGDFLAAPRCGASHPRRPCLQRNRRWRPRCRFHGGKSTGPRTDEGSPRPQRAADPRLPQRRPDQAAEQRRQACRELQTPYVRSKARDETQRRRDAKKGRFRRALLFNGSWLMLIFGAAAGRANISQAAKHPIAAGTAARPLCAFASLRFNFELPRAFPRGLHFLWAVPAGWGSSLGFIPPAGRARRAKRRRCRYNIRPPQQSLPMNDTPAPVTQPTTPDQLLARLTELGIKTRTAIRRSSRSRRPRRCAAISPAAISRTCSCATRRARCGWWWPRRAGRST